MTGFFIKPMAPYPNIQITSPTSSRNLTKGGKDIVGSPAPSDMDNLKFATNVHTYHPLFLVLA
jgi:hypothetical protein